MVMFFNDFSGVNIQNKFEPACVIYSRFYRGKVKFSVVSVGQSVRPPVHTGSHLASMHPLLYADGEESTPRSISTCSPPYSHGDLPT